MSKRDNKEKKPKKAPRTTVNMMKDVLVYCDDKYLIYRKDEDGQGTLEASADIIKIGINGLSEFLNMFKYREDQLAVINQFVLDLMAVTDELIGVGKEEQ